MSVKSEADSHLALEERDAVLYSCLCFMIFSGDKGMEAAAVGTSQASNTKADADLRAADARNQLDTMGVNAKVPSGL